MLPMYTIANIEPVVYIYIYKYINIYQTNRLMAIIGFQIIIIQIKLSAHIRRAFTKGDDGWGWLNYILSKNAHTNYSTRVNIKVAQGCSLNNKILSSIHQFHLRPQLCFQSRMNRSFHPNI